MAIIRTGHTIAAISGSISAVNFRATRSGPVAASRPAKIRQHTEHQLLRRARYHQIVRAWPQLPLSNRLQWNHSARQLTLQNRLDIPRHPSGFQFFLSFNLAQRASTTITALPPTHLILTPSAITPALTSSVSGNVYLQWYQPAPPATANIYFSGSRSLSSAPRHHFRSWRFLDVTTKPGGPNDYLLTTTWDTQLGHPLLGEVIAVNIRQHNPEWLFSPSVQVTATTVA